MSKGKIVAGALAPHPPHLIYAANPEQNEPKAECGWEELRWGYERLQRSLDQKGYDVIVVLSPHWRTMVGTHFLGLPKFKGKSIDPIFPNLFRFNYEVDVDVDLAKSIFTETQSMGMAAKLMTNPEFRVDYGTIISCHLTNPKWDKPIVAISSQGLSRYYSNDVLHEEMMKLGQATKKAVEASGKKAVLLASHSLSHRHFVIEPEIPEDMSREHVTNHHQYLWDMKILNLMRAGKSQQVLDVLPDFTEQTAAETDCGGLNWLMSALDIPTYRAEVHGYGSVIGTGNAVVEWDHTNKPEVSQ